MTTLVTGAAGFVGARVAAALARAGHEVHAVVRGTTSTRRLDGADVVVHRADLLDTPAVSRIVQGLGPDVVVHAAAAPGHGGGSRTALWRDTVLATVSLLDALDVVPPTRLVHLGSSTEYAPSPLPLREDDTRTPTNPRGVAKAAAWLAVREWALGRGVPVTALRLFRVYGAHEPAGRLVPAVLRALEDGTPVPLPAEVVGRDWVHVDDVAEACVRAAAEAVRGDRVLNVGRGESLPPQALVAAFSAAAGREVPVDHGAWVGRPLDVAHWCADLTALTEAWGWQPGIDLAAGARLTLEAHLADRGLRVGE